CKLARHILTRYLQDVGMGTGIAACRENAPMEMQDVSRAASFVQVIDVLGNDGGGESPLNVGDCNMPRIGLRRHDQAPAPFVPAPDQIPISSPGGGGRQVLGIERLPQSIAAGTKRGNAAVGGH